MNWFWPPIWFVDYIYVYCRMNVTAQLQSVQNCRIHTKKWYGKILKRVFSWPHLPEPHPPLCASAMAFTFPKTIFARSAMPAGKTHTHQLDTPVRGKANPLYYVLSGKKHCVYEFSVSPQWHYNIPFYCFQYPILLLSICSRCESWNMNFVRHAHTYHIFNTQHTQNTHRCHTDTTHTTHPGSLLCYHYTAMILHMHPHMHIYTHTNVNYTHEKPIHTIASHYNNYKHINAYTLVMYFANIMAKTRRVFGHMAIPLHLCILWWCSPNTQPFWPACLWVGLHP